jgi:hypothetical protein
MRESPRVVNKQLASQGIFFLHLLVQNTPYKRTWRGVVLTTHPVLAPRSRMSRAIPLLPLWALCGLLYGDLYLYLYKCTWQLPVSDYFKAVEPPGCQADRSTPFGAQVKTVGSCTFTPSIRSHGVYRKILPLHQGL